MEYQIYIELTIWLVLALIAKVTKFDYLFKACDFYLIFILSNHRWFIAVPAFIIIIFFINGCNWLADVIQQAVIPELRHIVRSKTYYHDFFSEEKEH